ncbi:hypothetical protein N9R81_06320, partial [Flavobacteriales bacterium]|nr:hypothetical protein [Flavobacteriales bacterium]
MNNKSFRTSFFVGLCFTIIGLILMLFGLADLGLGLFFFLPLAVGLSSGLLPDLKQAFYGTLASLFIFSIFLVF